MASDYSLHWDGDLWIVEANGDVLDGFTDIESALDVIRRHSRGEAV
jgi:hypothetical protein